MNTLESLFSPARRKALVDSISKRYACRSFGDPLSIGDWASISYIVGRYVLPGARLTLMHVTEDLFTGTLLNMGRVSGCTTVAVVIADAAVPNSVIHAGILGEALCLEVTGAGFASCWISSTYRKKQLSVALRPGESVQAIIALGHPSDRAMPPRKRKNVERFCKGDPSLWPEELRQVAEAVRLAPSEQNGQPVTMHMGNYRFSFDAPPQSMLDLGIALCHAELALTSPHRWRTKQSVNDPTIWMELT
jgi:hypothetical protein